MATSCGLTGCLTDVADHGVRLPDRFVNHVLQMIDWLETAERDERWWRETSPAG